MRRPLSLTGRFVRLPVVRNAWARRGVILVLVLICLLLALFPQKYRAVTSLTPSDPSALGLAGAVGQLGAQNSVFGNQTATEISLKIAQSPYVGYAVMDQTSLPKRLERTPLETMRWLHKKIDIRVMRGGIIEIQTTLRDPDLGKLLVTAYAEQLRSRLSKVARNQTTYKRQILIDLVRDSNNKYTQAQAAYDKFRLRTHYSAPESSIPGIGTRIPQLEGMIKSKQMELATAQKFATGTNFQLMRIQAELTALHGQLDEARSTSPSDPDAIGRVVQQSTEADRLKRDLDLSLRLYESYKYYLKGTSVEDLTSNASIRILEPAFIDPERQYNWSFIFYAVLLVLGGLAIEFYTMRLPVGDAEFA